MGERPHVLADGHPRAGRGAGGGSALGGRAPNGHKIVVTIEADTVDDSHDIASGFIGIEGVTGINLVYANFEDDPTLAEAGTR